MTGKEFTVILEFGSECLKGMQYKHPLDGNRVLQLKSAQHVSTDKGTGLVHTAPAHGLEDFVTAQENNLLVVRLKNYLLHLLVCMYTMMSYPIPEGHFLTIKYAIIASHVAIIKAITSKFYNVCLTKTLSIIPQVYRLRFNDFLK